MKSIRYIILILLFSLASNFVTAQWIQSLTVVPANPTPTDSITVFAECMFGWGGCADHTQFQSITGSTIYAGALHCLGNLAVICNYTDTFHFAPLPAGSYTLIFQVDNGQGPSPCTPGIVAGPSDSVSFVVSPAVGADEAISQDAIQVIPNPFNNQFTISGIPPSGYPVSVELYSSAGGLVHKQPLNSSQETIRTSPLANDYYSVRITTVSGVKTTITAIKR